MKPLQTSKSTPAWQTEHSAIALRACLRVKAAIARGETFTRALQIVSRYYHGRPYSCEPSRRLKLAPKTLMGIYYLWQGNDENPAALKLNYKKRPPFVHRGLMIQFLLFCATKQFRSVNAAWQEFSKKRRNVRIARGISYGMVRYHFRAAEFYQLKTILRAREIHRAKKDQRRAAFEKVKHKLQAAELKAGNLIRSELEKLKARVIADLTNRLPERPPARRVKQGNSI